MTKTTSPISSRVSIKHRYTRAIDIQRDHQDPAALEGYLLTVSAQSALRRLSSGLSPKSTQRAFRVTGPYGSGKSSFGLLLTKLFDASTPDSEKEKWLANDMDALRFRGFKPVILSGQRVSFTLDLLVALKAAVRDAFGQKSVLAKRVAKTLELRREDAAAVDAKSAIALLSECSKEFCKGGSGGILLLIDEMGRYLEFAAARPLEEDPSVFQLIAECASGSPENGLGVVCFLHHRFGDYAQTLGDWGASEWARSAERYEEIPFSDSQEQSVYLLAEAIQHSEETTKTVIKSSASLYKSENSRRLFSLKPKELSSLSESLFPLHPGTLAILLAFVRKFGQHERSIFSFLQSSDPAGFQQFIAETKYGPNAWYHADLLFDHFSNQSSFRFSTRERKRRWQLALDAVLLNTDLPENTLRIAKVVGLISTAEPLSGLEANAEALAWLLNMTKEDVEVGLQQLLTRGVIYYRARQDDYSLWSNTSVDLTAWFEKARAAVPEVFQLDAQVDDLPSAQPIVAQKHYHDTGTLRTFKIGLLGQSFLPEEQSDGIVFVRPVYPNERLTDVIKSASETSKELGPTALIRLQQIERGDLQIVRDLNCWRWLDTHCPELRIDDLSRAEVSRQIQRHERLIRRMIAPLASVNNVAFAATWIHKGSVVEIGSREHLNRFLSGVCDQVFSKAPVLTNELINREKLSVSIAAARMRLLKLMLESSGEEHLGLIGAPPEKTIFLSMFHASEIYRAERKVLAFRTPPPKDPKNWRPAWNEVEGAIGEREGVSFDSLISLLAKAPFGLRAGPAMLLIAAVMMAHKNTISLLERGTFQPELTGSHFMRLAKTPKHFELRRVSAVGKTVVFRRLKSDVQLFGGPKVRPELKSMTGALYEWWRTLSDFARQTKHVGKTTEAVRTVIRKSTDPVDLFLTALPNACDAVTSKGLDIERYTIALDTALTELQDSESSLRTQASVKLTQAFGVRNLSNLRVQIRADYRDQILRLADYDLRAFVDRAMNDELEDRIWLDGVAGLIVGKRLDSWDDDTLDKFSFGIREMAQKLARRLALLREEQSRSAPVTAVHVTRSNGEHSRYIRNGVADVRAEKRVREALKGSDEPIAVLISLLEESLKADKKEHSE